jgi:hypothetical protein
MSALAIRNLQSGLVRLLRAIPLASLLLLSGCLYGQNRDFAQLAADETWLALPMGSWLGTQDYGEPEAVAACLAPTCRNRMAVAVFRLEGEKARRTEAELRQPQLLAQAMTARQARAGDAARVRFDLRPEAFSTGGLDGFSLVLARRGEEAALLHAAAVGRRDGADLRVVFAVGDDGEVVRAAVAQLVAEGF